MHQKSFACELPVPVWAWYADFVSSCRKSLARRAHPDLLQSPRTDRELPPVDSVGVSWRDSIAICHTHRRSLMRWWFRPNGFKTQRGFSWDYEQIHGLQPNQPGLVCS